MVSSGNKEFGVVLTCVIVGLVVLYATVVDYSYVPSAQEYAKFADVQVMTFVGLGFLLTFIARNGLTGVGHSFMAATFVILWYILTNGFFTSAIDNIPNRANWRVIKINVDQFIRCDFAATAAVISFGAVFGCLNAGQLLVFALLETVFYSFNEAIIKQKIKAADVGAGFYVHTFAAFFGVCAALVACRTAKNTVPLFITTLPSEVTSMIGTLFLWIFFPSWNSVFATSAISGQMAVVNTILAIATSTVVSFLLELIINDDRCNLYSFQRAAISGGIAMAASANFNMGPHAAMIIGAVAGTAATLAFAHLQPVLMRLFRFSDTNGVLSGHLIPSIVGGLTSVIVSRQAVQSSYGADFVNVYPMRLSENRSAMDQASWQLAALAISIAFGIVGGLFTGVVVQVFPGLSAAHEDAEEYDVDYPEPNLVEQKSVA